MNDSVVITIDFNGYEKHLVILNTNKENTDSKTIDSYKFYNLYNFNNVRLNNVFLKDRMLYCETSNSKILILSCDSFRISYTTAEKAGKILEKGDYFINLNLIEYGFIKVR